MSGPTSAAPANQKNGTDVSRETSAAPVETPAHEKPVVDSAAMEAELAAFKDCLLYTSTAACTRL